MGIIWRIAMPLLSTLAALVIIVHSAEEDLDPDYRYELRSRALDTGTPSYDQPWRVVQSEPMMHQSTPTDWNIGASDEFPKRRRPGRKRKRRPIETSTEDFISQDKYTHHYEPSPSNQEPEYTLDTTDESPRRRRKKLNTRTNRWADDTVDTEKSVRRRGYRRKRPTLDTWPELSEFSGYHKVESSVENDKLPLERDLQVESNLYKNQDSQSIFLNRKNENNSDREDEEIKSANMTPENEEGVLKTGRENKADKDKIQEDKSLSEFSAEMFMEEKSKLEYDNTAHIQTKLKDKSPNSKNEFDKVQAVFSDLRFFSKIAISAIDSGPIDPHTLKEILKRSNGTSLSEILQQHNLSLADLLHGKDNVISILKSQESKPIRPVDSRADVSLITKEAEVNILPMSNDRSEYENETIYITTTESTRITEYKNKQTNFKKSEDSEPNINIDENVKRPNRTRFINRRRFPLGIRKKLRMRPMVNSTYKGQISRDMMALNARRYYNRRNDTKFQQWKDIVPLLKNDSVDSGTEDNKDVTETTTTLITTEDITTITDPETYPTTISEDIKTDVDDSTNDIEINTNVTEDEFTTITTLETTLPVTEINTTEKPVLTPIVQLMNTSTIRRQAYNNRLKRKRLKLKNSTTELPRDNTIKSIFGPGIMSTSEFITKTTPKLSTMDQNQEFTALEDFMTTETSKKVPSSTIFSRTYSTRASTSRIPLSSTTEETAKFEIEEILNDTRTSARLSKILMERNMTLNELVEHRERGSSHVHLADIFHNASREPNPPEPFLSKSLIEPISKETYPLRALLEANLHDPIAKTTEDPSILQKKNINIPVVMDFGNNVNENAENMGIMSLFNNFSNSDTSTNKILQKDSQGTLYESSVTSVNSTNINDGIREGRLLNDSQDLMNWKEIFAMIRKINKNETEKVVDSYAKEPSPSHKKITVQEDIDGDGLIVLEDLQHLRDFDSHIAPDSNEKLELNSYERTDVPPNPGILDKIPNNTKSVTVATASIVGLATILFLLTYAAFKWRQQKKNQKKRSFCDGRIPTPVFENRKGNKNNSSSRSISPMLSSSNIYTMNTIDSHHGKDSPEYMWDTLRKPFQ
ncbi:uncharacterized protein ACR2FA_004426 [Aphomia sociella]